MLDRSMVKTNRERFKEIIGKTPKWVQECFEENGDLRNSQPILKGFGGLSHHEKTMVAFTLMVWTGDNNCFPKWHILSNLGGLDSDKHKIIAEWVCNPFWM